MLPDLGRQPGFKRDSNLGHHVLTSTAMSDRRPAAFLVGLCVLLAAAQVFAAIPQLHPCSQIGVVARGTTAAGLAAASGGPAARWAASLHLKPVSEEECPICRIANLALVMRGAPPASGPSLRTAQVAAATPQHCSWLRLDSACGRAPPLA